MTPVYAYIRVSDSHQLKGDGPIRQGSAIKDYAASNSYHIDRVFVEDQTGTTENRDVWLEMIAACKISGIKTIIIEGLDRLARDLGVQEYILLDVSRRGIEIISTREADLCTKDATRVAFRQMMGVFAQYDRTMLTLKLAGARKRMRDSGQKCEGAYKYGEHPNKPEETRTLEVMRALRDSGNNFLSVTTALNSMGLKPRSGQKWHYASVQRILKREEALK